MCGASPSICLSHAQCRCSQSGIQYQIRRNDDFQSFRFQNILLCDVAVGSFARCIRIYAMLQFTLSQNGIVILQDSTAHAAAHSHCRIASMQTHSHFALFIYGKRTECGTNEKQESKQNNNNNKKYYCILLLAMLFALCADMTNIVSLPNPRALMDGRMLDPLKSK